jgi:TonB family protein
MRLMQAALSATLALFLMGGAPPAQPVWTAAPTGEAILAAYPEAARLAHLGGRVFLSCSVTAQGGLEECRVLSQSPEDQGFGAAALVLAPGFRMREVLSDGAPALGQRFTIPIRFVPPDPADAIPWREVVFHPTTKTYDALGPVGPYFPDRAARNNVEGVAVIQCRAAADGALTQCVPISAAPAGWGFEDASRIMAQRHWITAAPRLENGQPVDGEVVRVEVPFKYRRSGKLTRP